MRSLMLGKSRIEALSDGVFAITMTLLVLKLEVPEVMHHSSNGQMLQQLLALGPAFATYVVTFLIAGGFWFLHHLTFHFIRHVNGFLVWINLIFLMLVALLPSRLEDGEDGSCPVVRPAPRPFPLLRRPLRWRAAALHSSRRVLPKRRRH